MNACTVLLLFCLGSITGSTGSAIVGGKVVKPHSRPYMASLQTVKFGHICGGFLIREDFVLTAAHCRNSENLMVVLGAHNIKKKESSQQKIPVAQYFKHPDYKKNQYHDDIMLLKLKTKAKLNKYVQPIRLPRKDGKIPAVIKCSTDGWGLTTANGAVGSDVLKEATERLQFNQECGSERKWSKYFNETTMLCTTFNKKTGGICQGDSGGPLVCNKTPQGITAFTAEKQCDNPKYPHVFTKVSFYIPWIKQMMKRYGNVE
ncbi:granzyme E-like [Sphaeramia orbicularis]|nr:granzyme E-like [Sphaeramia orbicularis]